MKTDIFYKPKYPQIVMLICGVAVCFLGHLFAYIMGLFFVAFALVVQLFVKDHIVMSIDDKKIVFFNDRSGKVDREIWLDEVVEWNINRQKPYSLYLKLNTGEVLLRESFQLAKANRALRKLMPKKETLAIKQAESRKTKLAFKNPFKKKGKEKKKMDVKKAYFEKVKEQIQNAYFDQSTKIKDAANIIYGTMVNGGVVQLFGARHGNEFVNELNFRAGGLAPYHGMNVSILDLEGLYDHEAIKSGAIYDDVNVVDTLLGRYKLDDRDMIILVSKDGNEPLVIELAKRYKANGQKIIAIVNKKSYDVSPKLCEDGKLLDYADMYLDMCADEPDLALDIDGIKACQTSSTVANVLAQMLTAEVYNCFIENGKEAPVLLSANIKGADVHNNALTDVYEGRVR